MGTTASLVGGLAFVAQVVAGAADPQTLDLSERYPGQSLEGVGFTDDSILFVTAGPDSTREKRPPLPPYSSLMYASPFPSSSYISVFDRATRTATVVDTCEEVGEEALVAGDAVWIRSGKELHRRSQGETRTVLSLSEGTLRCMSLDGDGNLWVGGLKTGLFKVSPDLEVQHFLASDSALPTDSMTAIHVDDAGQVWVALWDCCGMLRIKDDEWTVFDAGNSAIPRQAIWSVASQADGSVWIGLGFVGPMCKDPDSLDLMRFDGLEWRAVETPVPGTVRRLAGVGDAVVALIDRPPTERDVIAAFDGQRWTTIHGVEARNTVISMTVDKAKRELWTALNDHTGLVGRTVILRYSN